MLIFMHPSLCSWPCVSTISMRHSVYKLGLGFFKMPNIPINTFLIILFPCCATNVKVHFAAEQCRPVLRQWRLNSKEIEGKN